MKDSEFLYRCYKMIEENLYGCYQMIQDNILWLIVVLLLMVSIFLMFYLEDVGVRWWLRLPGINLLLFIILLIAGCIEEVYLTFHPNERTKWIRTSIFQNLFKL